MNLLDRMWEAHRFWTTVKGNRVVPAQQDFPNCKVRYTKCCYDDRKFWEKSGKEIPTVPSKEIPVIETHHEQILHNVNGFKIDKKRDDIPDTPKGFEDHTPE